MVITVWTKRLAALAIVINVAMIVSTIVVLAMWWPEQATVIKTWKTECQDIIVTLVIGLVINGSCFLACVGIIATPIGQMLTDYSDVCFSVTLIASFAGLWSSFSQLACKPIIVPATPVELVFSLYQWIVGIFFAFVGVGVVSVVIYHALILPVIYTFRKCSLQTSRSQFCGGCSEICGCSEPPPV